MRSHRLTPSLKQTFRATNRLAAMLPVHIGMATSHTEGEPTTLHPEELVNLERFAPRRLREFAAGRACARAAMQTLGWPPQPVSRNPDRSPRWPSNVVGSISHAGDRCVAVVSRQELQLGLGIDIEERGRVTPDLWPVVFKPIEIDQLRTRKHAALLAASLIFSAKEAFFKFQYPQSGDWLDFLDATVEFTGQWQLKVTPDSQSIVPACAGLYVVDVKFVVVCLYIPLVSR